MIYKQLTLRKKCVIFGVGLHTGKKIKLEFVPANINTGIIFRRKVDLSYVDIPVLFNNIIKTNYNITVFKKGFYVKTVEHLLSAIFALGIDNIIINISSDEVPFFDGSAYPFIYLFKSCGLTELNSPKIFLKLKKRFILFDKSSFLIALPHNNLSLSLFLGKKKFVNENIVFNKFNYINFIAKSRTFGFYEHYKYLFSKNLIKGCSFKNTLIFKNAIIFNKNLVRYHNEVFYHKILDFFGDIFLSGKFIIGFFYLFRPSHEFNNKFLNYLIFNNNLYDLYFLHKKYGFKILN